MRCTACCWVPPCCCGCRRLRADVTAPRPARHDGCNVQAGGAQNALGTAAYERYQPIPGSGRTLAVSLTHRSPGAAHACRVLGPSIAGGGRDGLRVGCIAGPTRLQPRCCAGAGHRSP
ncbi:hypothetical protein XFF6992_50267 [Xanthomonas citri pv. fuscans]|nr:hypothetical protein XFF6992_50267 [Xanthomonas citri pv. fuscans]SOO34488.1 hypothetical protein XFF6994_410028 [Xanthomonas citri pv. fuscans]